MGELLRAIRRLCSLACLREKASRLSKLRGPLTARPSKMDGTDLTHTNCGIEPIFRGASHLRY